MDPSEPSQENAQTHNPFRPGALKFPSFRSSSNRGSPSPSRAPRTNPGLIFGAQETPRNTDKTAPYAPSDSVYNPDPDQMVESLHNMAMSSDGKGLPLEATSLAFHLLEAYADQKKRISNLETESARVKAEHDKDKKEYASRRAAWAKKIGMLEAKILQLEGLSSDEDIRGGVKKVSLKNVKSMAEAGEQVMSGDSDESTKQVSSPDYVQSPPSVAASAWEEEPEARTTRMMKITEAIELREQLADNRNLASSACELSSIGSPERHSFNIAGSPEATSPTSETSANSRPKRQRSADPPQVNIRRKRRNTDPK